VDRRIAGQADPIADALIAAAAQDAGVEVLHYDHHYDRLAQVLSFASVWLAPAGALERSPS
jgi:predicted nucleic acid-binding protein